MLERRLRCIASNNQPKFRGVIDKENNTWPVTGFLISEWLNCCSVETSRSSRDRTEYFTIIVKTSVGRCCSCLKIATSLQPLECLCLSKLKNQYPEERAPLFWRNLYFIEFLYIRNGKRQFFYFLFFFVLVCT